MKKAILIPAMLLTVLMFTTFTRAQNVILTKSENAIKSLEYGIKSDNEGLKRSSIYLAGKNRISEVVDALVEKMSNEKNPSTRILIALSLYEIRNPKGMKAVQEQSLNDSNDKVKRMSAQIFAEYLKNSDSGYVTVNN